MSVTTFSEDPGGVPVPGEPQPEVPPLVTGEPAAPPSPIPFRNSKGGPQPGKAAKVGLTLPELRTDLLARTGGWPKRVGTRLFVATAACEVLYLDSPATLFAWLNEMFPVVWASGPGMVSREVFFRSLQMHAEPVEAVELFPHFPPLPKVCYVHSDLPVGDGSCLQQLLSRFKPATPEDAGLLKAFFLTLFWGGAPGSRPAFLFTSRHEDTHGGRGVGKSTVSEMASYLCGGVIEVEPDKGMAAVKTRLLSDAAQGLRIVRIDNLKEANFGWAELEGLLTSPVVSGRQLFKGEGRRPNVLIWTLTVNGASLSRDLAQRCVIIVLDRPEHQPNWKAETVQFIQDHRLEILADIRQELEKAAGQLDPTYTRWAAWEAGVLSRVDGPASCQKVIRERQETADSDSGETALVAAQFREELERKGHAPEKACVFIPSRVASAWLQKATGQHRATNKATGYLATLGIQELTRSKKDGVPGWRWRGQHSSFDTMSSLENPRDASQAGPLHQ